MATHTIGWREWLSLPDLDIHAIKAKVDTGAASASLHAFALRRYVEDGREMVAFDIRPRQHARLPTIGAVAEVVDERLVRNPGGREEVRPVIRTNIRLGDIEWSAEVNLTRRDQMGFRMLLGRKAIRRRFVVDPSRSFLLGKSEGGDA